MSEQDWDRHWSTISLGIVTIATAAIGGALFAIERTATGASLTTLATYSLEVIAIVVYLYVLVLGGRVMFSTSAELSRQGTSKRDLTRTLYVWFFIELFALAGPLIGQAFARLLQSLAVAPAP